jgi:hypothetical protein
MLWPCEPIGTNNIPFQDKEEPVYGSYKYGMEREKTWPPSISASLHLFVK